MLGVSGLGAESDFSYSSVFVLILLTLRLNSLLLLDSSAISTALEMNFPRAFIRINEEPDFFNWSFMLFR